jgi:hypothetical protein
MSATLGRIPVVLGVWTAAAALLWWGRFPGPWRRALALLTSAAGLVFLILALNTQGLRESATTAVFLVGRPYVTEQVSASASLPYYVATALCLLLGTLGLAVNDDAARGLRDRWLAIAIALSLAVTATRFWLEKVAAPQSWSYAVGVTWLAPVVGAFFALNLRREGKGLAGLTAALLLYGFAIRAAVAALMVVASTLRLGSHYDVSALVDVRNPLTGRVYHFAPGSFSQVWSVGVVPQLAVWPIYTLLAGLLGAAVALGAAWAAGASRSMDGTQGSARDAPGAPGPVRDGV